MRFFFTTKIPRAPNMAIRIAIVPIATSGILKNDLALISVK